MSEIGDFFEKVKERFSITDAIFLVIQNDGKLMKDYLDLVGSKNLDLQKVNMQLGKLIQTELGKLGLNNRDGSDARKIDPISTLIQSCQQYMGLRAFPWIK